MEKYDHEKIEKKWQDYWEKNKIFEAKERPLDKLGAGKFYGLVEFPYASGDGLHTGHLRSYTAMDILCRQKRMQGKNVLYPMGFDNFGLPTENYAIKKGVNPKIVDQENTKKFTQQLKDGGFSFDWSRAFSTTDEDYYKWTQWIFIQLFKKGLAYKSKEIINWCIKCKIGLANEEVVGGACERCGGEVVKKDKEQWVLKITEYADRLIEDLDKVDYLERIKTQQVNWIGKSEGAEIDFKVKNTDEVMRVFTTRPDTLFGATFMVVAPEHELISKLRSRIKNIGEVEKYIEEAKKKSDIERGDVEKEKTGVELVGVTAINPVNNEEIPIWVADYVMMGYGTGSIMAVPAHDQRDWDFAKKYDLEIRPVISAQSSTKSNVIIVHGSNSTEDGSKEKPPENERHWKPWLKENLERQGFKVSNELYPNDWSPNYNEWRAVFEKNDINENTILIGHSAGGAFLVRWLYETKKSIKKLILVSPGKSGKERKKGLLNLYGSETYKEISNYVKNDIIIFTSDDDIPSHIEGAEEYKKELPAKVIKLKKHGHFTLDDMGTEEFPELLDVVLGQHGAFTDIYSGKMINSGDFNGMTPDECIKKITDWLERNNLGKAAVNYKLHDWIFSRQRYWGEPIPIIYCRKCWEETRNKKQETREGIDFIYIDGEEHAIVPVDEKDLPVTLPEIEDFMPTDEGNSPLAKAKDWLKVKCPKCGEEGRRETDVMPNWAGSNWYFVRYADPKNDKMMIDPEKAKYWLPVDWYNGGMEHTTLHLLYSRFIYKFLYDIGAVPKSLGSEPYKKRTAQGMILGEGGIKMSKSKGNVINPDDYIKKYGADTVRMYEMFMGPFDQAIAWDDKGVVGVRRFLDRAWQLKEKVNKEQKIENKDLDRIIHQTIKKVTDNIEDMRFNTAVSQLMILVNFMEKLESLSVKNYELLIILLSPFAPHLAEELWQELGHKETIVFEKWPEYNEDLAKEDEIELVVQVNGKVRDKIQVAAEISEDEAKKLALDSEKIQKWLEGKEPKKVIFVKGKLVNIVV